MYVHGGEMEQWLDDGLYVYDTESGVWEDVAAQGGPSARHAHAFVGVADARALLFGGDTLFGKSNELFELDLTTITPRWVDHTPVSSRAIHRVAQILKLGAFCIVHAACKL